MANYIQLESGTPDRITLEDGSGFVLLEFAAAFTAIQRRTSGFMTVRVGSRAVLTLLIVAVFLCF